MAKMNRADKQVSDEKWIEDVLERGNLIHIGIASPDGAPYVVPMGYGYENGFIYLHGAANGLKNDLIAINSRVSFNVSIDVELVRGSIGANFTNKYRSVTGFGDVEVLTDLKEKNMALSILMRHYDGPHEDLNEGNNGSVWVAKIQIKEMTGKSSGYPKP
ncbi:MAG: pyridoxamine 5'-phosphate oxidase family protein [Synergistaceae bacterium]|nr:pyridoxamine 5'-phosphate oxidase family protein [Synergistaceae bacterium]